MHTPHTQHTPTTVGLVTPMRPGTNPAAMDALRGGTRSHRDISQNMQRSRHHHPPSSTTSSTSHHHPFNSPTITEHDEAGNTTTTTTGSAPPHQRRLERTRSRSSQRKSGGGSTTPTSATATATSVRASPRSARGNDGEPASFAPTAAGLGGDVHHPRGHGDAHHPHHQGAGGGGVQGEAFEELVLSESPPAVDVHVTAVPRHQRSLSAGGCVYCMWGGVRREVFSVG